MTLFSYAMSHCHDRSETFCFLWREMSSAILVVVFTLRYSFEIVSVPRRAYKLVQNSPMVCIEAFWYTRHNVDFELFTPCSPVSFSGCTFDEGPPSCHAREYKSMHHRIWYRFDDDGHVGDGNMLHFTDGRLFGDDRNRTCPFADK